MKLIFYHLLNHILTSFIMLRFNWSKAAKYPASPGKEVPIYIYMFDLYTVINWKGIGTA